MVLQLRGPQHATMRCVRHARHMIRSVLTPSSQCGRMGLTRTADEEPEEI